ncbi:MAG: CBASS cGAMP-activated phospholipase [Chloroflexota bacterium]|nr:CBASS cGAMP-activated phospholipase [Chloroflexota bacterium]
MKLNHNFSILALDGGGVRGIYGARILARLETTLGARVKNCFDLIAGVSTGSILAGATAASIPMSEIVRLFEEESPRIFRKRRGIADLALLWRSRYSQQPLADVLQKYVPDLTLAELSTPLLIPSTDLATGGVHVFKSRYLTELGEPYSRDGDTLLRDAILASCAAPTFFNPKEVDSHLLADGGLWANNPSIIALTEAVSKFNRSIEEVRILSLGTGHAPNMYRRQRHWGLLTGWGREKLVSYTLNLQSQASTNMAKMMLGPRYLRLDPTIDSWQLDDVRHIGNLKALADQTFDRQSRAILAHVKGE